VSKRGAVLTGEHFMTGDFASAEGALAAGCRFFAGYPITPATEVAERMSERLPEIGGIFIQMEDEMASMNAILGASWGGVKSMTSTSGPGFSLMMENLGLGIVLETPCVLVNIQRGGPSTGLPTLVEQGDMMQARWGSHGHYEIIALSPSSPQECFDLTIKAFNLSEKYRTPVLLMADETVGHMTEKVVIPPAAEIPIVYRKKAQGPNGGYRPFRWEDQEDEIPPMVSAGEGYRIHVTGLTHDERGYPVIDAECQKWMVEHLIHKIQHNAKDIHDYRETQMDDAEIAIVTYGISARTSYRAMELARRAGIKVGILRLVTVWPFPEERIRKLAAQVKAIVVVEINFGQIKLEVERCARGNTDVALAPHAGGEIHDPNRILDVISEVAR
jgi:2-oxoglutarate ferredoxin oxidoreductase subunit alpha